MEGIRGGIMAGTKGSSTVRLRARDRIGGMTTGMVVITGVTATRGGIGSREQVVEGFVEDVVAYIYVLAALGGLLRLEAEENVNAMLLPLFLFIWLSSFMPVLLIGMFPSRVFHCPGLLGA
jgi:hypothetical protein